MKLKQLSLFMTKVDLPPGCWEWRGYRSSDGYGRSWNGMKVTSAQRVVYEFLVGPIPEGMTIDHLCRNRGCVRPDHLEAVPQVENMRRTRWTHCLRGHPFTGRNLYIDPKGKRRCRLCADERARQYRARKEAI